ncbi:MAG: hypothetical protein ABL888_10855 [Pirellulaceae bacterium]
MNGTFSNSRLIGVRSLGDLIRSPFSEKFNWRRRIADSGLPTEVCSLITAVVIHSRLMRYEKFQVASDLVAHFEDGNASGKSFTELIATFGDPRTVADLIRAGKERNRPMLAKWFRGGMWVGSFSIAGFLGLSLFFYLGKPQPSVDYLPSLNADLSDVAEADKAWPIYRGPWAKYEFCEGKNPFLDINIRNEGAADDWRQILPSDGKAWEKGISQLSDAADLLEAFRVGGAKPVLGLELKARIIDYSEEDARALFPLQMAQTSKETRNNQSYDPMDGALVGILLPHVQTMRHAARILTVDTRWALEQGDLERATRNIEATFGFARQASEHKYLICGLVAFAIHNIGCDLVDESLAKHLSQFSDLQLERIQLAVTRDPAPNLISVDGERAFVHDTIQRVYTDDGNGDGRITPEGLQLMEQYIQQTNYGFNEHSDLQKTLTKVAKQVAAPLSLVTMASRKNLTVRADILFDLLEQHFYSPFYEDNFAEVEREFEKLDDSFRLLADLFPAFSQTRKAMFRGMANQEATAAGVAVLRFQRKHGKLPKSLEELVGEFLNAVPKDQINGAPINYLIIDEKQSSKNNPPSSADVGFRIYSVGVDRDDDRAAPIQLHVDGTEPVAGATADTSLRAMKAGEFNFSFPSRHDGDWVLWPRGTAGN